MIDPETETVLKTLLFLDACRQHKTVKLYRPSSKDSLENILAEALEMYNKIGKGPQQTSPLPTAQTAATKPNSELEYDYRSR